MTGADIIVLAVVLAIVGLAIGYIIKKKKSGAKCIGCPSGGCCPSKQDETCSCGCQTETK